MGRAGFSDLRQLRSPNRSSPPLQDWVGEQTEDPVKILTLPHPHWSKDLLPHYTEETSNAPTLTVAQEWGRTREIPGERPSLPACSNTPLIPAHTHTPIHAYMHVCVPHIQTSAHWGSSSHTHNYFLPPSFLSLLSVFFRLFWVLGFLPGLHTPTKLQHLTHGTLLQ